MGYQTWHNYGYGVCVSDIKESSVERVQAMLKLAPNYNAEIQDWFEALDITAPTYEDYIGFDDMYCLGLATLMRTVIEEAEGIEFSACDDFDGRN